MSPLPSYGSGREHPGPRYGSFIHGQNLKDVVITGQIMWAVGPLLHFFGGNPLHSLGNKNVTL